jgi:hypothetical protein
MFSSSANVDDDDVDVVEKEEEDEDENENDEEEEEVDDEFRCFSTWFRLMSADTASVISHRCDKNERLETSVKHCRNAVKRGTIVSA